MLAREGLLPVLAEVREGRTAPMDPTLRPAAQPPAAEPPPVATPAGISWGDDDEPPATGDAAGGGISWDVQIEAGDEPQAAPDGDPASSGAAGINWDIDVSSSGQGASVVAATAGGGSEAEAPAAAQHATALATGDLPVTIEVWHWPWGVEGWGWGSCAALTSTALCVPGQPEIRTRCIPGCMTGVRCAGGSPCPFCSRAWAPPFMPRFLPRDPQRLIDDAEYRIRLLDDLLELRAFLSQVRAWQECMCGGSSK